MQITMATEYAVRCVLHLALHGEGRTVPRREIAGDMDIPEQFLGKVAQRLSRAGLLQISQGARGGYRLLVEPQRLTLLAVVEAAEGGICLNQCLRDPKVCSRTVCCSVHRVWARARQALRQVLAAITFAELASAEAACVLPPSGGGRRPRASRSTGRR